MVRKRLKWLAWIDENRRIITIVCAEVNRIIFHRNGLRCLSNLRLIHRGLRVITCCKRNFITQFSECYVQFITHRVKCMDRVWLLWLFNLICGRWPAVKGGFSTESVFAMIDFGFSFPNLTWRKKLISNTPVAHLADWKAFFHTRSMLIKCSASGMRWILFFLFFFTLFVTRKLIKNYIEILLHVQSRS